jgi:hypothetical protein
MILRPKRGVVALATIAVGLVILAAPDESRGQDRHRCWWFLSSRERDEYAAEAASLGVRGGAPLMGFPEAIAGLGPGIVRVPFPTSASFSATSGGPSSGSYEAPAGNVPPQPAASGLPGTKGGGPVFNPPPAATGAGATLGPGTVPSAKTGLSPLPTTTTSPSGRTVGPAHGSP